MSFSFKFYQKFAQINKKPLLNPMILKFLSAKIAILGKKTFKTMFSEKIFDVGRKRQKDDFSKKKLHFEN